MVPEVDKILKLHLLVLRRLLSGDSFEAISIDLAKKMKELGYLDIARNGLLSFDEQGTLIGVYPVSPLSTSYKVDIENVGSGYSMCAIDSLGIAYTFMEKTTIQSKDHTTGEFIELVIDPASEVEERELYVTYVSSDDSNCDPAIDQCPSLNFYTSIDHIEHKEKYSILTLAEAVQHAIEVFGARGMRKCIEGAIAGSRNFALSDILIDVFEK